MKKLTLPLLLFIGFNVNAENSRRAPKMAPIFEDGYYVNLKGDTVNGQIQTNIDQETTFYTQFCFKGPGKSKPRVFTPQRIKAYGYNGRHFVMAEVDGNKQYIERLETGRLRFFEYKYHGKIDGYPAVVSDYYIKDTRAEGDDADLKELRKLPKKFYKKALKPYMEDQPMIWSDLDKYSFNENAVLSSIKEFNKLYTTVSN